MKPRLEEAGKVLRLRPEDARKEYFVRKSAVEQASSEGYHERSREALRRLSDERKDGSGRGDGKPEIRNLGLARREDGRWTSFDPKKAKFDRDRRVLIKDKTIIKTNHVVNFGVDLHHRHVHGPKCGHDFHSGRWHDFDRSHKHGSHCGHSFYDNHWHSFPRGHTHGIGCGHFFDGGIWLSFGGSFHRHHAGCGHYFFGGFWHNYSHYHVHGPGCGHWFHDDFWHDFPAAHIHGPGCGHYYDGVRWFVTGYPHHEHYDGCGHFQHHGGWYIYPETYYRRYRPGSFYFFTDLGRYEDRYVPSYVTQVQARYEQEPVNVFEADDPLSVAYAAFANFDYYNAIVAFNDAIQDNPDDGLLYFARAQAYIGIDDYASAYADIMRGMELIPDWGRVRFNMTELYSNPEEFSRQLTKLEGWADEHPRDTRTHFVLGYVYYFIQEFDLAKSELVYVLAAEPDHAQAQRLIQDIYERQAQEDLIEAPPVGDDTAVTPG